MPISLKRSYYHTNIYIFLLCILAAAIPLSNFFMSAAQILLCANWVLEGNFKEKFSSRKNNILLISIVSLFFIHVIWLINTQNIAYGLHDIKKKLPLLIIPLVLFMSKPLSSKQNNIILSIYCLAVLGGSIFGFSRYIIYGDTINYRTLFPYISHIRFALNICLVIFILLFWIIHSKQFRYRRIAICSFALTIIWFFYYLTILHSYTGLLIIVITSFIFLIYYFFHVKEVLLKTFILLVFVFAIIGITFTIHYYANSYYTLSPLSKMPQKEYTTKGNAYSERDSRLIENGNYVYNYVCEKELKEGWGEMSSIPYKEPDFKEYPVRYTLIRYLNSKGLTKDTEGLSKLDSIDVRRIEKGIANVYYVEGNILQRMIYVILFEHEHYKYFSDAKGHSLYQRFELWKTSLQIIQKNFWFGVGTGDVADAVKQQLIQNNSVLKDTSLRSHNQFLTFFISFGVFGFLIFIISLFYLPIKEKEVRQNLLFLVFFCISFISMMSEDTLETEAGVTFFAFFYSFFGFNSKKSN